MDGVAECESDCDDDDDNRFPGNPEVCDNVDNDCNDEIDDGLTFFEVFPDEDGDGFGDDTKAELVCEQPEDTVLTGGDCDDANAGISPDMEDIFNNDIDEDCDGVDAEGCGCSTVNPGSSAALGLFLSALALIRRRRV